MNIKDLTNFMRIVRIDARIDASKPLRPTTDAACDDSSLLFVYERVGGNHSVSSSELLYKPYAIVCEEKFARGMGREIPLVVVEDARRALARACYLYHEIDDKHMKIIAVTGTNGKTTTATMLARMLNDGGMKCGFIGTGTIMSPDERRTPKGYSMTTPDPELLYASLAKMQASGCEAVVIEATSHAIALGKLAPISFERGIFTNLSHEHMDFHNSIEDYYRTKLSLFSQCRGGIFNVDDEYGKAAYLSNACPSSSVGIISDATAYATDIESFGINGSRFLYREDGLITRVELKLPGPFNVYNAMLAMRCAIELGITPKAAKDSLKATERIDGRMEKVHAAPLVVIDYAHTPFAMENTLKTLKSFLNPGQKLISVFGCGGNRDKSKRPLMGSISEQSATYTILTSDNSRDENAEAIIADIASGFSDKSRYTAVTSRADAIRAALEMAAPHDVIAILGKGHERYIIDRDGKKDFDEREIVAEYYEEKARWASRE